MSNFWQIEADNHRSAITVLTKRHPERAAARANWGEPSFIFVTNHRGQIDLAEVGEWFFETGIEFYFERAGTYTFIELKSEADAVAFKLRWF